MDISELRNVIQKLKNYSPLSVPVVIGLIGVLVFVPTQLMSRRLKTQIESQTITVADRIESLKKNPVAGDQWKEEMNYQESLKTDANQISLLAKQSTQRGLLSYAVFPEPKGSSTLVFEDFGKQFLNAIDALISKVNALDCPTETELDRALSESGSTHRTGRRGRTSSMSGAKEYETAITEALCQNKAKSVSVYANPANLSGHRFWQQWKYSDFQKEIDNCWYSQLAYWVIEDVIDTIGVLNSGSDSVFTSPVKRLLGVSFTRSDRRSMSGRRTRKIVRTEEQIEYEDKPIYVSSARDGLTEPHTGRFSNDDIDVVHFSVVVVVSIDAIPLFIQELCSAKQHKFSGFSGDEQEKTFKHNQITILESRSSSIDREDTGSYQRGGETHKYYRYGEDAVIKLDLICEYIFNRNGYDEIKPKSFKAFTTATEEK